MLVFPKIMLVGLALKERYTRRNIPSRILSPPKGLWRSFIWISLGLPHMIVLAERSIVWLSWMTTQDIHGSISSRRRVRPKKPSSSSPMKLNVNTTQRYWLLEATTAPSSRTTPWMNFLVMRASNINIPLLIPPQQNGVAERKNRTLIDAARTMMA